MPPTSPPPPPAPPTEHTWNSLYFPPIEIPPVILYRPIQPRFELVLTPPTELVFQFYLFSPFPAFSAGIPDAIWVFVPHLLLFLPLILFNSSRYAPGGLHGTWRKSKFFCRGVEWGSPLFIFKVNGGWKTPSFTHRSEFTLCFGRSAIFDLPYFNSGAFRTGERVLFWSFGPDLLYFCYIAFLHTR